MCLCVRLSVRDIPQIMSSCRILKSSWGVLGQASRQASKEAGKQASRQVSKQASRQASKQASKQAVKQARRGDLVHVSVCLSIWDIVQIMSSSSILKSPWGFQGDFEKFS